MRSVLQKIGVDEEWKGMRARYIAQASRQGILYDIVLSGASASFMVREAGQFVKTDL